MSDISEHDTEKKRESDEGVDGGVDLEGVRRIEKKYLVIIIFYQKFLLDEFSVINLHFSRNI